MVNHSPSLEPHPLCAVTSDPNLITGRLAATGSADQSIKILDVDRMMSKSAIGHVQDLHPVIRTLYDHTDVGWEGTWLPWALKLSDQPRSPLNHGSTSCGHTNSSNKAT